MLGHVGVFFDRLKFNAQAAGMLFSGQHAGGAGPEAQLNLGLGRPMTIEERASEVAGAFDAALQLRPNPQSACSLLLSKCTTLGWIRQHAPPTDVPGSLTAQEQTCITLLKGQCGDSTSN